MEGGNARRRLFRRDELALVLDTQKRVPAFGLFFETLISVATSGAANLEGGALRRRARNAGLAELAPPLLLR